MKRLLLLSFCSLAVFAQSFPGSIYTPAVAADNVFTTLSVSMQAVDTTAFVASTSRFAANMYVYICDASTSSVACTGTYEVMKVTSIGGANALNVARAQSGTTAIPHAAGKVLSNAITSIYNKTLSDETLAIETFLGTNGGNLPGFSSNNTWTGTNTFSNSASFTGILNAAGATHTSPTRTGVNVSKPATCGVGEQYFATDVTAGQNIFLCTSTNTWTQTTTLPNATAALQYLRVKPSTGNITTYEFAATGSVSTGDYIFPAQTPGGSLSPGSNTVSMIPCPLGINGTDANHYVYISAGTGTAEAVLLTGGSCTSNAAAGTLTFTAANSHSGAWTVSSATAGIQEAIVSNPTVRLFIPSGTFDVYAPITFATTSTGIAGQGLYATILNSHQTGNNFFTFPTANTNVVQISNLQINGIGTQTAGAMLNVINEGGAAIDHVYLQNAWAGIATITFNNKLKITDSFIYFNWRMAYNTFVAGGTEIVISNVDAGGMRAFGTIVANSAYLWMVNASVTMTNFWCVNGAVTYGWYFPIGGAGIMISNSFVDQFQQYGLYVSDFTLVNVTNTIIEGDWNYPAAPTAQGAFIGSTVNGGEIQISNSHISSGSGAAFAALFIDGPALTDILINNCDFPPLGSGGGTVGIYIKSTGSNSATRVSITGNKAGLGQQSGGVSAAFGLLTGQTVLTNWNIQGNDFYGTAFPMDLNGFSSATNTTITNNNGVDNVIPSVAQGASLAAPVSPFASTVKLTAATAVTGITNFWAGRTLKLINKSGGALTILGISVASNASIILTSDGTGATGWY